MHMLIFAATLTVTLYALTDMEYPLLGSIRIKNFDHFLVDAYQQMQGGASRRLLATADENIFSAHHCPALAPSS
jgi:hypothetical protein